MTDEAMAHQTIVTPAGERLVILPEADYRDLVDAAEDAVDLAAVETFRRRLADGEEEMIPQAIVERLLEGENRIRVWREHRGLTPEVLAQRAEIAPETLAATEAGLTEGSVADLRRLAKALSVTLDDLVG